MNSIEQIEKRTQGRVVTLFRNRRLRYDCLSRHRVGHDAGFKTYRNAGWKSGSVLPLLDNSPVHRARPVDSPAGPRVVHSLAPYAEDNPVGYPRRPGTDEGLR